MKKLNVIPAKAGIQIFKTISSVILAVLFSVCIVWAGGQIMSGGGVATDTNCNQAQYYGLGVLCQDTDDGKLYKGTGSAIAEVTGSTYDGTGVNITASVANITTMISATANITTMTAVTANITTMKMPVAADNTLSGTPIIITVYDAASNTPYYFKAYPTKP